MSGSWQGLMQVSDTQTALGPGLQAAIRTFGTALDRLPTIQIRNPNMYSLAHADMVQVLLTAFWKFLVVLEARGSQNSAESNKGITG